MVDNNINVTLEEKEKFIIKFIAGNNHVHPNKAILDLTTAPFTTQWEDKINSLSGSQTIFLLNEGETGPGVTDIYSGIEIDRGTLTNYRFVFNENTDSFEVGEIGSLQKVATREDSPIDGGIAIWDGTTIKFVTTLSLNDSYLSANIFKIDTNTTTDIVEGSKLFYTEERVSLNTDVTANTTHRTSDGSDHTFINQDVTNTGNPTFAGLTINGNIGVTGNVDGRDISVDGAKLDGIEPLAEVNNISDLNALDLTGGGDSILHYHATDRARSNHTGTQLAATISDFQTTVSLNTDVSANATHRTSDGTDHTFINQDIRTTASPTFLNVSSSNNATANSHLVRLDQLNSIISGLDWQQSVLDILDFTIAEPPTPITGNRYINTVTGTSSVTAQSVTANYIYEWNGSSWDEFISEESWTLWVQDVDTNYTFNGTNWVEFGSTVSHNNTTGLQGGTTNEYYHLTSSEHGFLSGQNQAVKTTDSPIFTGLTSNDDILISGVNKKLNIRSTTAGDQWLQFVRSDISRSFLIGVDNTDSKFKIDYVNADGGFLGTGTNILTADTSGKITIPNQLTLNENQLISKSTSSSTNIILENTVGADQFVHMRRSDANVGYSFGRDNTDGKFKFDYFTDTTGTINPGTGITAITINDDSNAFVGIGTIDPSAKLEVAGSILVSGADSDLTIGKDGANARSNNLILTDNTYEWWVRTNSDGFEIRDNLNSTTPFEIKAGAPDSSIWIASNGNVGFGTNDPQQKLRVVGDIRIGVSTGETNLDLVSNNASNANINFLLEDNSVRNRIYMDSDENLVLETTTASDHILLIPNGNIGIRTTSPNTSVEIGDATSNETLTIQSGGTGGNRSSNIALYNGIAGTNLYGYELKYDGDAADFRIIRHNNSASGVINFLIDRINGYVGIGNTSAPLKNLDIVDTIGTTLRLTSTKNDSSWLVGDIGQAIEFYNSDASGTGPKVSAMIATEIQSTTGSPSDLVFSIDDGTGNLIEAYRIDGFGVAEFKKGIFINQDSNNLSINIDSEATTQRVINIDSLTTNLSDVRIYNNAIRTGIGNNAQFLLATDNASSTGTVQTIYNDGTGDSIFVDSNNNATSVNIDSEATSATVFNISAANTSGNVINFNNDFVLDYLGNVGIGTTSPSRKVEIVNSSASIPTLFVRNNEQGTNTNYADFGRGSIVGSGANLFYRNIASAGTNSSVVVINQANAGDDQPALQINQAGTGSGIDMGDSSIINTSQVVVGATSSIANLEVLGGSGNQFIISSSRTTGTNRNWLISSDNFVEGTLSITPSTTEGGSTFSSPAVNITPSGQIGFNISSPQANYDFNTETAETTTVRINGELNQEKRLQFRKYGASESSLENNRYDIRTVSGDSLVISNIDASAVETDIVCIDGPNKRVGINTDTPDGELNISGTVTTVYIDRYTDSAGSPRTIWRKARGTESSPTAVLSGDFQGLFRAQGYDGSAFGNGSEMEFICTENWSGSSHGSAIDFFTVENGTIGQSRRLRINHNGFIGIGTDTPGVSLDVNPTGTGYIRAKSGLVGDSVAGRLDLFGDYEASSGLTILDSGNVGIGTTNPAESLHVVGQTRFDSRLRLGVVGDAAAPDISWTNDINTGFYLISTGNLGISTGGIERARFTSTGTFELNDNNLINVKTAGFTGVDVGGSKTASFNVDFDTTQSQSVTLTANTMTATLQTPVQNDATRTLYITNGGLATLTWASTSGTIKWVGGSQPTLTSSGIDIIVFRWDGTDWYGAASLNFS